MICLIDMYILRPWAYIHIRQITQANHVTAITCNIVGPEGFAYKYNMHKSKSVQCQRTSVDTSGKTQLHMFLASYVILIFLAL